MLVEVKTDIWINCANVSIIQRNTVSESPRIRDPIHKITMVNNNTIELPINDTSEEILSTIMNHIGLI